MKINVKTLSLCLGLASLALGQTTTAPIYQMSILAGIPTPNSLGDNGNSTFGIVSSPQGVALDANGNIYIADNNDNKIRQINATTGIITTWASTGISSPVGLAFDHEGNLWVSQTGNDGQLVRLTTPATGVPSTSCTTTSGVAVGTCVMADTEAVAAQYGGDGDFAFNTWFDSPQHIAIDANDNIFIADSSSNRIRMIKNVNNCIYTAITTGNNQMNESCRIVTIAGNAGSTNGLTAAVPNLSVAQTNSLNASAVGTSTTCGVSFTCNPVGTNTVGDGGPALGARVWAPNGIAVSPNGSTVYFSDLSDQRIRVINMSTGIINTVIGNCTQATGQGTVSTAGKGAPGIITCTAGNYGTATATGAANGVSSLGDGRPASQATVSSPRGLFLDNVGGYLWFADTGNNLIRNINLSTGIVNTVVGGGSTTGDAGVKAGSGALTSLSLSNPYDVFVYNGLIYWSENGIDAVRVGDPVAQVVKTLTRQPRSTGSGGPATSAYLGFGLTATSSGSPRVAVDNSGNVYVLEASTQKIRQINSSGIINEWAGTGAAANTSKTNGDGGPALVGQLSSPQSLAFDSNGNGYIADSGISRIRMVNTSGVISTVAGRNQITTCSAAVVAAGTCFLDKSDYVGDGGPPAQAIFSKPQGVTVDANNNLIVADTGHNAIRYLDMTNQVVTTIAGGVPAVDASTGQPHAGGPNDGRSGLGTGGYQDATNASYALFLVPRGIAVDKNGNIYLAEWTNSTGRVLNPTNQATHAYSTDTFYGSNSSSGTAPGIPTGTGLASVPLRIRITSANQSSVAVDTGGNIYYALQNDNRVNVVSADHSRVYIVAGGGTADTGLNYTSGNAVNLQEPQVTGVAVDSNGVVYTADHTGVVRKLVCTKNCLPLH